MSLNRQYWGRNAEERDKFFTYVRGRVSRTDDIRDLKENYGFMIPLFVFDKLKSRKEMNHILQGCPFLGRAVTLGCDYVMMRHRDSDDTVLFHESEKSKKEFHLLNPDYMHVEGEVYGVPLDMIMFLDGVYENGSMQVRIEDPVVLLDQKDKPVLKECQFYMGIVPSWSSERALLCRGGYQLHNTEFGRRYSYF